MKKLITLIFSAVLLCPMLAGAATTTPSVAGPILWSLGGVGSSFAGFINSTQIPYAGGATSVNAVEYMIVNITDPKNSEGFFSIAGTALVYYINPNNLTQLGPFTGSIPVTGTMIPTISINNQTQYSNGGTPTGYVATFYIGTGSFTCNLSVSTLNGTCIGNNGQSLSISYSVY
ncbi:hypothetical protein [Polynucleobacter sp. JS-Fieb-80-E5]|uniref:hypothetical protein n=1 Tax=Polynucleobacter sp. JS-Fieb-80-E5 TaxID=2081050 RepID=UPI001C0B44D6|nr:hypothetical protein [Polynucleobacter sp. JS-Fieb-80-E5]MBU3618731.1 hypothetical protein [Polynucleobacter sp. JS-Fieb-80-E5]